MIDLIQSILQSKEAKNLSKQAIRDTSNLAMAFKDKRFKKKANSDNQYYNYYKFGHFGRDSFLPKRKLNRMTQQSRRRKSQRRNSCNGRSGQSNTPNRAHQAVKNKHNDNSDPKPFAPDFVGNAFMIKKQKLQKLGANSTWFLDSCTFRHFCNKQKLFSNLKAKSIKFVTVAR